MSEKKPSVLISGASTGIGEDVSKLLAQKGWAVFAGVRKESDAEKLRSYHTNITPVILDVTKEEEVTGAIGVVREAVGEAGLDVLINNAGLVFGGPMEFMPMTDVYNQYEVNVFGTLRLTQAAMPLIRMGRPGRIINVGSIAADQYMPFMGAYDGSKAALQTLSESLRRELKPWDIKVVFIKPGPVATKFTDTAFQNLEGYKRANPPDSMGDRLYGKDIDNLSEGTKKLMEQQVHPSVVSERIYEAMTSNDPKNMYYDTWKAYFSHQLYYWMPVGMMDNMMSDIFFAKER